MAGILFLSPFMYAFYVLFLSCEYCIVCLSIYHNKIFQMFFLNPATQVI